MFRNILLASETYSTIHCYLMFRNILLNSVLKNGHKPLFNNDSKVFGGKTWNAVLLLNF